MARDPAGFVAKGFRSSGHLVPGTDIGSPTPEPNPSETTTSLDSPHVNHDPLVTLADETVSNDYRHLPWDPNCCRFTETCYVIMNRDMSIARSENRVINAINDPDAWDRMLCCMALWARSCQDINTKEKYYAPKSLVPPPGCMM